MRGVLKEPRTVTCPTCGNVFTTSHPSKLFCDRNCKQPSKQYEVNCLECGIEYTTSYKERFQLWCSDACKEVYYDTVPLGYAICKYKNCCLKFKQLTGCNKRIYCTRQCQKQMSNISCFRRLEREVMTEEYIAFFTSMASGFSVYGPASRVNQGYIELCLVIAGKATVQQSHRRLRRLNFGMQ